MNDKNRQIKINALPCLDLYLSQFSGHAEKDSICNSGRLVQTADWCLHPNRDLWPLLSAFCLPLLLPHSCLFPMKRFNMTHPGSFSGSGEGSPPWKWQSSSVPVFLGQRSFAFHRLHSPPLSAASTHPTKLLPIAQTHPWLLPGQQALHTAAPPYLKVPTQVSQV